MLSSWIPFSILHRGNPSGRLWRNLLPEGRVRALASLPARGRSVCVQCRRGPLVRRHPPNPQKTPQLRDLSARRTSRSHNGQTRRSTDTQAVLVSGGLADSLRGATRGIQMPTGRSGPHHSPCLGLVVRPHPTRARSERGEGT